MRPVKIVADSTCDLTPELIEQFGIDIIPLYVNLGGKLYRDVNEEINVQQIFDYVSRTGTLPGTVGCSVADFTTVFQKWTEAGYDVVCITISSEMSVTFQSARLAAESFEGVYPVDSRNLSTGVGHVVINGALLAQQGLPADEIARRLQALTPRVRASFILDNLDYMKKGGRCSTVAAFGANLLRIKPTILVENGSMRVGQKFRGTLTRVLEEYVDAQLAGRDDIVTDRIFITHTGEMPEAVEAVRNRIAKHQQFDEVIETHARSTITSHCGPNTLGILFVVK